MSEQRGAVNLAKHYFLMLVGLWLAALGVAFSIRSGLGTTSISSLPYVASLITPLTVGAVTILMNLAFLAAQVLILRRRFRVVQLLQIPVFVLFGLLTDLSLWLLGGVGHAAYWQQWTLVLVGIVLVGVGVACQLLSDTVMLSADAFVLTVSRELSARFGARKYLLFGYLKIISDVTLVVTASALSLIFLDGLYGVREGTVAAALLIGLVAKNVGPVLAPLERHWLRGR